MSTIPSTPKIPSIPSLPKMPSVPSMPSMDGFGKALDIQGTLSGLQNGLKNKIGAEVGAQLNKLQNVRNQINAQMDKVNQAKNLINQGAGALSSIGSLGGLSGLTGLSNLGGIGSALGDIGGSIGNLVDSAGLGDLIPDGLSSLLGLSGTHIADNMMCLGDFVFKLSTIPYHTQAKSMSWRHPESSRVGAAPVSQFAGPDNRKRKLDCLLCPELTGGNATIDVLILMADSGEAFPLIDGQFNYQGHFLIEKIDQVDKSLLSNGLAREIDLTIELKQVPEDNGTA